MKIQINMKIQVIMVLILISFMTAGCGTTIDNGNAADKDMNSKAQLYDGKKILYINSYAPGLPWSDREQAAAEKIIKDAGIEFKIIYMDSRYKSEEYKLNEGIKAKEVVEEFKPDVIIAADDNAFKYVIMDHYRDAEMPVVFAGINGDVSVYGGPYTNTAGIEETPFISQMIGHILPYANGTRSGYLSRDCASEHQFVKYYSKHMEGGIDEVVLVKTCDEWLEKFLELQDKVDYLILGPCGYTDDCDYDEFKEFIFNNIKIPVVTQADFMAELSLIALALSPKEHGEWAAKAALEIIGGKKPNEIPIVQNKQGILLLNVRLANKLGIVFQPNQIKNAEKIYE